MNARPLAGITVVSVEQAVAAPYATRQLADLGARVIKIERADSGDFARRYDRAVLGESSYFVWLNRSKESVAIDLKDDRGVALLWELVDRADVFVENLAPGACARLGFSVEALHARNKDLIICSVTGYGRDGPWASRKAYDLLVQAETGLVSLTGDGDVLAKVGISVADIAAGMQAYAGVLSALFKRATSGEASVVGVSLFDALSEWMGAPDYYTMYGGEQPRRIGVEHATIAPYGLYFTKDREAIVLAVQNEREWVSLSAIVLGDESIARDARFSTNVDRVKNRDALSTLVDARIAALSYAEAAACFEQASIAYGRVNSIMEALNHPVLSERGRFREVDTPGGMIRALVPPVDLSGVEARMDPVPVLGAHTKAVLTELGRTGNEIAELAKDGVVLFDSEHQDAP